MDIYGVSSPDLFRVDDVLDFSNDNLFSSSSSSSFPGPEAPFNHHSPSAAFHPSSFPIDFTHDLCVPSDDIAQLEWLSHFVDDSFSDFPANPSGQTATIQSETSFPGKARSKRSRRPAATAAPSRTWKSALDSEATVTGKARQKEGGGCGRQSTAAEEGMRRCTHCASEKTPQWRTGPHGPKTLCNACGVRYKSGRLVPEYRPAASPTFVLTQHSNSHRKVMELRRQKEQLSQQQLQLQQNATAPVISAAVGGKSKANITLSPPWHNGF